MRLIWRGPYGGHFPFLLFTSALDGVEPVVFGWLQAGFIDVVHMRGFPIRLHNNNRALFGASFRPLWIDLL